MRAAGVASTLVAALAAAPALAAPPAAAPDRSIPASDAPPSRLRFVSSIGYDFGIGRRLEAGPWGEGRFRANTGVVAAAGGAWALVPDRALELQATLGVKYESRAVADVDVGYSAYPVEVLAAWQPRRVRLAGGLSLHLAPRLRGSEIETGADEGLRTAVGLVAQAEYVSTRREGWARSSFGVRILWLTLERAEVPGTFAASSVGLFAGLSI
jgi:hypothetical protein